MSEGGDEREPDVTVLIIKEKGANCAVCNVAERVAKRKGENQHVLLVKVELESDLEKKLAGVRDDQPVIDVKERSQ